MLRGISFCICMLLTLSLFAQNEESNLIVSDSLGNKRTGNFKRIKEIPQLQRFRHSIYQS